jgi:hypothetical protein
MARFGNGRTALPTVLPLQLISFSAPGSAIAASITAMVIPGASVIF